MKKPVARTRETVHFCATCQHIRPVPGKPVTFICSRLGFATKPRYRFDCWSPRSAYAPYASDTNAAPSDIEESET